MAAKTTDTSIADTAVHLRNAVVRTSRRLRQEAATETGLTPTQTAALASINRSGPLTPSELAEIERVKRPSMTRTLACLEREGLVERTSDPTDGRSFLVAINAAGRTRMSLLRRRKSAYLARRLRELSPAEVETLARAAELLERMREDEQGLSTALRRSFNSLEVPNYRRYFIGQVISLSGNWMQSVTALWLVLSLTNSGFAVGLTTALQFLPMLLFGAYGGVLADRLPKRKLLFITQSLMMIPALGLFLITAFHVEQIWMIYIGVFLFGAVNCVDNPTRQSFVIEMVGPDRLVNAVSLNSVIIEVARIVGPAIAGLLIAGFGVVPCFGINLLTFLAMIAALWSMDPRALQAPPRAVRKRGAVREGLRYVRRTPELRVPLALMALVGTLGFNFQVALPLLAKFSFGGGAGSYAVLVSAMGAGSIVAALVNGNRGKTGGGVIAAAALAFGLSSLLAAAMPDLVTAAIALALLGGAAVTFVAAVNSTIQLTVSAEMRGRVMALFSIVFLGSTPIGGPLTGWLSEAYDPRIALVMAGVAGLLAAWIARGAFGRLAERAGHESHPLGASA